MTQSPDDPNTHCLPPIQLLQHRRERFDPIGRIRLQPDLKVGDAHVRVLTEAGGDLLWRSGQGWPRHGGRLVRPDLDDHGGAPFQVGWRTSYRLAGGIDPVQLYVSIAGLAYFYLSNSFTLSSIFGRDLLSAKARSERLSHMCDVILGYVLRN